MFTKGVIFLGITFENKQCLKLTALNNKLYPILFESVVWNEGQSCIEMMDVLFSRLKSKDFPFSQVVGISGGASHETVYLKESFPTLLANLDPSKTLSSQLNDYRGVGGNCTLLNAFMASLLIGKISPIDYASAVETGKFNAEKKEWEAGRDYPQVVPSYHLIGYVSDYFIKRYAFSLNCQVIAWSGNVLNNLIGLQINRETHMMIHLGENVDTLFGVSRKVAIPNPVDPKTYIHIAKFHHTKRNQLKKHFLCMRIAAEKMGGVMPPHRLVVTGSNNRTLLSIISSIFGSPAKILPIYSPASLGAAYRAVHGLMCHSEMKWIPVSLIVPKPKYKIDQCTKKMRNLK